MVARAKSSSAETQLRKLVGCWEAERDALVSQLARSEVALGEVRRRLGKAEAERDRALRRCERQAKQIAALKAELEEARRASKRQAAPFARRRRKKHPKRPGRRAGHAASHRAMPDQIDEEVFVPLDRCPCCGGEVEEVEDLEPQVVVDPPPDFKLRVRRFHNQSGKCKGCRRRVQSRHPDQSSVARGAAGVQIGPRFQALALHLHYQVGVPFRKVSGIFRLLFGLVACAATWVRAARRSSKQLEPTYLSLVAATRQAAVVHVDETGWYIMAVMAALAKKPWLHVFAVPELGITLFAVRLSRGGDVAREMLGSAFTGTIGIDGWAAYISLAYRKGQCSAHLLRRCAELLEVQKRGSARFPLGVQRLLLQAAAAKEVQPDLPPDDRAALADQMRGELHDLLRGKIEEPANLRFAKHLRRHEDEIFTFLDVEGLGPTNNEAEREIRPGVVLRKMSAGNRTILGAHDYEIISSVSRTCERNGRLMPELLPALLCSPVPGQVLPVLRVPMPPPAARLPSWPGAVADKDSRHAAPRDVRRAGRRLDCDARTAARPPPPT
jgi:transposase